MDLSQFLLSLLGQCYVVTLCWGGNISTCSVVLIQLVQGCRSSSSPSSPPPSSPFFLLLLLLPFFFFFFFSSSSSSPPSSPLLLVLLLLFLRLLLLLLLLFLSVFRPRVVSGLNTLLELTECKKKKILKQSVSLCQAVEPYNQRLMSRSNSNQSSSYMTSHQHPSFIRHKCILTAWFI